MNLLRKVKNWIIEYRPDNTHIRRVFNSAVVEGLKGGAVLQKIRQHAAPLDKKETRALKSLAGGSGDMLDDFVFETGFMDDDEGDDRGLEEEEEEDVGGLQEEDVGGLKEEEEDVGGLEEDVGGLEEEEEDVGGLQEDVGGLQEDVGGLQEEDVGGLQEEDVGGLEEEEEDVGGLQDVGGLEEEEEEDVGGLEEEDVGGLEEEEDGEGEDSGEKLLEEDPLEEQLFESEKEESHAAGSIDSGCDPSKTDKYGKWTRHGPFHCFNKIGGSHLCNLKCKSLVNVRNITTGVRHAIQTQLQNNYGIDNLRRAIIEEEEGLNQPLPPVPRVVFINPTLNTTSATLSEIVENYFYNDTKVSVIDYKIVEQKK